MSKRLLAILLICTATVACGNTARGGLINSGIDAVTATTPTPPTIRYIQIQQASILPPYGMSVTADVALLKLQLNSSQDVMVDRLEDIRNAVEEISLLASENDLVSVASFSLNQVGGSSSRDTSLDYIINEWDPASITLSLETNLGERNRSLVDSLILFSNFLKLVNLPDTITIETISIETKISDPEIYRQQLISKVYQELEVTQQAYGQTVNFEITGIHSGLQIIRLTDTEYYIYIEPNIVVNESYEQQ